MQCFSSTYNIAFASASTFYPSRPQKNQQNHPHFTRLKIRRSAFYRRPNRSQLSAFRVPQNTPTRIHTARWRLSKPNTNPIPNPNHTAGRVQTAGRINTFYVLTRYDWLSTAGTSQLVTRSTRHIVKSCDELTVVFHGVVTSWPCF